MSPGPALLRVRGITKSYGDVLANAGIDFELRAGEVHALVGENGAGKTTLMQVLFGMQRPDAGTIEVDGVPVRYRHPRDAIDHGIGMVHQHFMLVPEFTIEQNVNLGVEPARLGLVDRGAAVRALAEPMRQLGMRADPHTRVGALSIAQQQRVELLKLVHRGARVMILDEPTAVLTPQETADLFTILRGLADRGHAVVFISHKLREVLDLADRVTVLRRGRTNGTHDVGEVDLPSLVAAMTGRDDVGLGRVARTAPTDRTVLEVVGLSGTHGSDAPLRAADLTARAGEVVGVAGVDGNGQGSLVALLTGRARPEAGCVRLDGVDLAGEGVAARRRRGLAYVPEDRHADGLPLAGTVLEALAGERLSRGGPLLGWGTAFSAGIRRWAAAVLRRFEVRPADLRSPCSALSGGNQQKLVVGRELDAEPRLVVLAQPTRGVDLGAAESIYAQVARVAEAGAAVVVVSADLDELLRLTDRILVLYRGAVVADLPGAAATREQVGHHMLGGAAEVAA